MQQPYRGISLGFLKTFLEGSVDRVIYRDYKVNRRFFIYCSLATRDIFAAQFSTILRPTTLSVCQYQPLRHLPWKLSGSDLAAASTICSLRFHETHIPL